MNTQCSACNKPIEYNRPCEILCEKCEIAWYIAVQPIYNRVMEQIRIKLLKEKEFKF